MCVITGRARLRGRSWFSWSRWNQGDDFLPNCPQQKHSALKLILSCFFMLKAYVIMCIFSGWKRRHGSGGWNRRKRWNWAKGKGGPTWKSWTHWRQSKWSIFLVKFMHSCANFLTFTHSQILTLFLHFVFSEGSWRETWQNWGKRQNRFKGIDIKSPLMSFRNQMDSHTVT